MSTHKRCGATITWARYADDPDRFLPPLEFAGHYWLIGEDGVGYQTPTFKQHECDPDQMEKWQERLRRIQELELEFETPDAATHMAAREQRRDEINLPSLKVKCDRCGQPKGKMCLNLHELKRGREVECRYTHEMRQRLAMKKGFYK